MEHPVQLCQYFLWVNTVFFQRRNLVWKGSLSTVNYILNEIPFLGAGGGHCMESWTCSPFRGKRKHSLLSRLETQAVKAPASRTKKLPLGEPWLPLTPCGEQCPLKTGLIPWYTLWGEAAWIKSYAKLKCYSERDPSIAPSYVGKVNPWPSLHCSFLRGQSEPLTFPVQICAVHRQAVKGLHSISGQSSVEQVKWRSGRSQTMSTRTSGLKRGGRIFDVAS